MKPGDRYVMVLRHLPDDRQPTAVHTVASIENGVVRWVEGGCCPIRAVHEGYWRPLDVAPIVGASDICAALHVAMLNLRRCNLVVHSGGGDVDLETSATCDAHATWSMPTGQAACDTCTIIYLRGVAPRFTEAPHAAAVRRWQSFRMRMMGPPVDAVAGGHEVVAIAGALLKALPSCPLPLSAAPTDSCARCRWATVGNTSPLVSPPATLFGHAALGTLTRVIAKVEPGKWDAELKAWTGWLEHVAHHREQLRSQGRDRKHEVN